MKNGNDLISGIYNASIERFYADLAWEFGNSNDMTRGLYLMSIISKTYETMIMLRCCEQGVDFLLAGSFDKPAFNVRHVTAANFLGNTNNRKSPEESINKLQEAINNGIDIYSMGVSAGMKHFNRYLQVVLNDFDNFNKLFKVLHCYYFPERFIKAVESKNEDGYDYSDDENELIDFDLMNEDEKTIAWNELVVAYYSNKINEKNISLKNISDL